MTRTLLLLCLLTVSCGDNTLDPTQPPNLLGQWSYTWPTPQSTTLHGTMTLDHQDGSNVFGNLGFPTDYPGNPADAATWRWALWGQQDGNRISFYAVSSGTSEPWWFELTVTDSDMSGPALAGYAMTPVGTFSAARE